MKRLRHFLTLALALAMSLGAWAQQGVLLTTVTPASISTYSQSPDGIVTVTLNNIGDYDGTYGWYYSGSVTVEAAQGYTITRCVFRQNAKPPLEDNLAPFTATMESLSSSIFVETSAGQVYGGSMDGITSIEVYGYAAGTVIPTAEGNWTFQMPGYNAALNIEYYPATLTLAVNNNGWGSVQYVPAEAPVVWRNGEVTFSGTTITGGDITSTCGAVNSSFFTLGGGGFFTHANKRLSKVEVYAGNATNMGGTGWNVTTNKAEWTGLATDTVSFTGMVNNIDSIVFTLADPNVVDNGNGTYAVIPGTVVTFIATPDSAHYFVNWNNDAAVNSNTAATTFTMGFGDTTLTANFAALPILTLAANDTAWGSVTIEVSGSAGTEVTIGDGTSTTYVTPYNSLYGYSFVESLYTAEEIGTAGTITSISYNMNSTEPQTNDFVIYMKNVSRSTFASNTDYEPVTDADIVYSGSVTFNNGWTTITLDTPIEYDGTSNLMIAFDENTSGYSTKYFYYTENAEKVIHYRSDTYNPDPYNLGSFSGDSYVSEKRANIKLGITSSTGLPEGVTQLTDSTYCVLPGTTVNVKATPDSAHYFVNWNNGAAVNTNTADTTTLTMGFNDTTVTANFAAKPTLTLAQTDGGTLAAIVPQGAGEETLLTTVTATDQSDYSQTPAGIVTVTLDNIGGYNSIYGWRNSGSVTVEAPQGYTITRCLFRQGSENVADDQAPFTATIVPDGSSSYVSVETSAGPAVNTHIFGITSIEVYGYQNVTPNVIASSTPNTYIIDYGTDVTVVATPDSVHYLANFDGTDVRNDNDTATKVYTLIADTTATANFAALPILTLASNEGGTLTIEGLGGTTLTLISYSNIDLPDYQTVSREEARALCGTDITSGTAYVFYRNIGTTYYGIKFQNGEEQDNDIAVSNISYFVSDPYDEGLKLYYTTGHSLDGVTATETENQYRVDYGTDVTVVATPDSVHYLANFDGTDVRNDNDTATKVYTITSDLTATANFAVKPTLTLASNEGGTLTLDGMVEPSVTGITFTVPGSWQGDNGTILSADDFPGFVSISEEEARNWQAPASGTYWLFYKFEGETGHRIIFNNGEYISTNSNSLSHGNYYNQQNNRNIAYTTGAIPGGMPAGVVSANATRDTFVVDYGTTVNVTATPDSAHYFVNWNNGAAVNSNTADTTTFTMGFNDTTVNANFAPKPTLTLAHNQGGEMEIVPEEVMAVNEFTVPSSWNNDNTLAAATDLPSDFQGVSEAEARAWQNTTGHPVYLFFKAYASGTVAYVRFNANGTVADVSTGLKSVIYNNVSDVYEGYLVRYTTVGYASNFIASTTEPNTYYIDYNTSVTVKATPDATHYLANFDGTDVRNDNDTATKTYTNITADTTATANFAAKPVLTLAANDSQRGTLEIAGSVGTVYTITFDHSGSSEDDRTFTIPASLMPYDTTFSYNANVTQADAYNQTGGSVSLIAQGDNWVTVRISGAFEYYGYYSCNLVGGATDDWDITCKDSIVPVLPTGIEQLTDNTYRVNYGTEVTLNAEAIEMHHVAGWQNQGGNAMATATYSNYAIYAASDSLFPAKSSLTFTVTGDTTSMAMFGINSYDLTAQVAESDDVRGTVSAAYTDVQGVSQTAADTDSLTVTAQGASTTTLTATPSWGYHFVGWLNAGGDTVSTSNPLGVTSSVDTALVALFDTTHAELAWDTNAFTGYTFIDFNNWKPTLDNPHSVNVRYGCVEGGLAIDAATGLIGTVGSYGHTVPATGSWHIYAVHDLSQEYFYDSVVYTLTVEQGVTVALQKNFVNRGTTTFPDYSTTGNLSTQYLSNIMAVVGQGQTIRVDAEPATGYHFTEWRTGSTSTGYTFVSNDVLYTFTVPNTIATGIQAVFDTNIYNVVANAATDDRPGIGSGLAMGTATAGGRHMHFLNDTLTATESYGYTFAGWVDNAGDTVSTDNPFIFSPVSDTTLTAVYTVNRYAVVALSADSTLGGVTGTDSIAYLASATLTATPAYGHRFTHWSNEAGDTVATTDTVVVTVVSDTTLTAHFVIDQFTVMAVSADTLMGTVAGTATVDYLDTVTLTATPLYGYHFVNWTEADSVYATADSIAVVATADRTLTANFAINTYLLTLAADADSMGVMSVALADTGSAGHTAASGQLTICDGTVTNGNVPAYGFYADAYLKAEMVYPASMLTDMPAGTEISKMTFYAADPATDPWTSTWQVFLSEVADTTISAFAGPGTVVYEGLLNGTGSEMTINFTTPYTYNGGNLLVGVYNITTGNYKSVYWTGVTSNGSSVQNYDYSGLNGVTPTQRNFLPKVTFDYAMEAADPVPPSGSFVAGSEPNTYIVEHGSELVITATANASYHMTGWSNGVEVNSLTTATQTVTIVSDSAITATFGVNPVLTLAATTNGTVAVSGDLPDFAIDNQDGSYSVLPGTAMSLVATPDAGYHVTGWSNGVEVNSLTAATQTVTVNSDTTISATFGVNPVVTLAANGNGTVAPSTLPAFAIDNQDGTYSVLPGTAFTFVATPDTHYYMTRWDDIDSMVNSNRAVTRTETINDDTAFSATFAHKPYMTIAALPDTIKGTVTVEGSSNVGVENMFDNLVDVIAASSGYQYGVATDGQYIYTSSWSTSIYDGYIFHQYDQAGNLIDYFNIDGVVLCRDMTSDGQYIYGANGETVYVMDLAAHTLVNTIQFSGAGTVRHISYDPVRDAFWVGNWDNLMLYSRTGSFIQNGPGVGSLSGTAFYQDGEDHLILLCQPYGNAVVYDYNINQDTITQLIDITSAVGVDGSSGGSFIGFLNGTLYWLGDIQNSPNHISVYSLGKGGVYALNDSTYIVDYGATVTVNATSADSNAYYVLSWNNGVQVNHPFLAMQEVVVTTDTAISATFADNPVLTLAKNEDLGWIALEGSEIGENLDLSTLTNDTVVADGTTIYGTLAENVKVSIADGATVYLDGVTINGVSNIVYNWAGLTCLGDATLVLDHENSVQGFYENYPGIYVPEGSTVTIQGRGTLTATGSVYGAGIGGGLENSCGNIVIAGGTIVATGGSGSAAIGSGNNASCGTITITGGNVTANCGEYAAGIGSGMMGSCGAITIADSVTVVTSDAGVNANSIGAGFGGTVASVTIGTTTGAQTQNPYTYEGNGNGWTYGGLPDGVTNNHDGTYTIRYGVTVNVIAKADEHHHVESWSNEVEVNNPSPANQYVTVTSDSTITVNFSIDHHAILAVMANDIMGETFGSDTVDYLDTVSLYATPATGYHFVEWTEADSLYSTSDTIVVVAIHDRTFTAHMDTNIYNVQIAVASANTGMGTVADTPDSVKHFLSASYEATPATGYHFAGWVNAANETVSTDNPVTVSPVSDTVLYATFDTNTYVLTVLAADTATGSVSGSDSAALHFVDYTITATPATCYQFVAWSDGDSNATRTVTLTSDSTIVAEFAYIARAGEETLVVCDSVTWNDSTYAVSGDYSKVLQTTESCDSTATLHLTVKYSTSSLNTAVACESYTWHNVTYTTSTLAHYDTINAVGCDSIANLDLTINYNTSSEETVVTCDSVYVWNGITYVSSTVGTWHTTDGNGCDSTATLYLTLNNNFTGVDTVTACGSYTWVDGVTYTESTDTPTYVFLMANGCDSTVTLNLTISNAINTVETVTACDSYEWHDSTYTASTDTATWTGQSAAGCDSTVTLHLTVNNSVEHSFDAATCSYYIWDGSYYNETGSYTKHYTAANGCDSAVTMNLTVSQTMNVAISDTACGTYTWNGVNYTASGAYTQHFVSSTGCDSTVTLTLTLNPSVYVTVMATACDSFEWHGVTYTETPAVDPTYTTTGSNGCDSVTTLHLIIAHSNNNVDSVTACDSYTWIDGVTYTASTNTPTYTIVGEDCNVTMTLHLTINNSVEHSFNASTCSYYIWDGNYYNENGSYTKHYTAANGCDSTAILNLTVNQYVNVAISDTACDSYLWNGVTYTASGAYTQRFTGSNNCDSTVTLTLTINHPVATTVTATACDSFAWHGVTYTETPAVAPTFTGTAVNGCDSVTTLNLTVRHASTGIETLTACDSLLWHGTVYTASNDSATYRTTNAAGCDSTVTLHLTVNNSVATSFADAACNFYVWDGSYYAQSGSYTKHYTAANGCDSASTLNLTVNQSVNVTVRDTACDSYAWNGVTYTASGAYTQMLTASTGCDSTVTLVLTLNRSTSGIETVTACNAYQWHGTTYTASTNTPTFTTTNAAGCDSTVTLHLTINNCSTTEITVCDSYQWHGTTYNVSGTYYDGTDTLVLTVNNSTSSIETVTACNNYTWHGTQYNTSNNTATWSTTNAAGCDSTVTLNLTINYSNSAVETVTACNSYLWHGTTYTASTDTPTYTTLNAAGCDSVTTLHLTILNCSTTEITACDSYEWHGTTYTESGTYIDGIDTLVLTVNYSNTGDTVAMACDEFNWYEHTGLTVDSDNLTHLFEGANQWGCDSTVTLHLTVGHSHDTAIFMQAEGSIVWNGETFTESGVYVRTIETVTGCDSVITFTFAILPEGTPVPVIYNVNDVVIAVNHNEPGRENVRYAWYRWYRDGVMVLEGADKDSYNEGGRRLNGRYYLEVATDESRSFWVRSNELLIGNVGIETADGNIDFSIAPNPAMHGQKVTLVIEANASDLVGAELTVYDVQGRQLMKQTEDISQIEATLNAGVYMVRLTLKDGRTSVKRLIVR